jgi:hypothetical protein
VLVQPLRHRLQLAADLVIGEEITHEITIAIIG